MTIKLHTFTAAREGQWDELDALVRRAGGRPERLGVDGTLRLGQLYRAAAADLALARRALPAEPVTERLHALVGGARLLVYSRPARRLSLIDFLVGGYWRLVAGRPELLAWSAALLLLPAAVAGAWAVADAASAAAVLPAAMRAVADPRPAGTDLGLPVDVRVGLSGEIFANNIRVSFLAFAGGIALGLGSAAILVLNGGFIGAVAGVAVDAGNGAAFVELVVPHGILELSCIVVVGAAGLRMGWALVDPGDRRRADALVQEARAAVLIVLGTAPWLVVAGLVEGLVTPLGIGLAPAIVLGASLGAVFWLLVARRGRAPVPGRELHADVGLGAQVGAHT